MCNNFRLWTESRLNPGARSRFRSCRSCSCRYGPALILLWPHFGFPQNIVWFRRNTHTSCLAGRDTVWQVCSCCSCQISLETCGCHHRCGWRQTASLVSLKSWSVCLQQQEVTEASAGVCKAFTAVGWWESGAAATLGRSLSSWLRFFTASGDFFHCTHRPRPETWHILTSDNETNF